MQTAHKGEKILNQGQIDKLRADLDHHAKELRDRGSRILKLEELKLNDPEIGVFVRIEKIEGSDCTKNVDVLYEEMDKVNKNVKELRQTLCRVENNLEIGPASFQKLQTDLARVVKNEIKRPTAKVSKADFRYTRKYSVWSASPEKFPDFVPSKDDL